MHGILFFCQINYAVSHFTLPSLVLFYPGMSLQLGWLCPGEPCQGVGLCLRVLPAPRHGSSTSVSWGVWQVHSTYMADTEVLEQSSAWPGERTLTFTSQSVTRAAAVLRLVSSTCSQEVRRQSPKAEGATLRASSLCRVGGFVLL